MRIYTEFTLESFESWSGARETQARIIEEGKSEEFDALCEELFSNGCNDTEMNDFLWFDSDNIFEMLGITDEEEEETKERQFFAHELSDKAFNIYSNSDIYFEETTKGDEVVCYDVWQGNNNAHDNFITSLETIEEVEEWLESWEDELEEED